ncbi:MAG: ESX secretion-associated protein EspG, partial [Thermocrispum sp.]
MRVRLAAALPTTPAARVHSATCSVQDLKAIYDDELPPTTSSGGDARRIAEWLEQEHLASGELHVALRDGFSGGQRSTEAPVPLWVDTEQGRALLCQDRDGWLNFGGADLFAVAELLATMEEQVRR